MEDFAVTEAPIDSAVDTAVETDFSADTGADATTEVESEATPVEGEPEAPAEPGKDFRPVKDGRLDPTAKAELDALKVKNPALAKAIQKALFAEDRLRRELPGGFKEVQELRGKLEELGGDTGIQEVKQEIDGWREFDNNYTAGDPKVLEFLTQTPEAAAAFLKIAPAAFEKFREAHPDGYAAYMTNVFAADMAENNIPLQLEKLGWMLKDNPDAVAAVQQIQAYVNRIGQMARKPVAAPATAPKVDDRAKQLDSREQQLTRTEWSRETSTRHSSLFQQQWKAQIGDRKLSDTQAATVRELYGLKLAAILKARPDFNQNLERYFSAKQKDGFLKLFDSVYKDAVPRALRTAIQQVGVGAKPGPKPGEPKPVAPGTKPIAPNGTATAGFTFVGAKPEFSTVDNRTTTPEMWQAGRAILRNGTKVYWRKA